MKGYFTFMLIIMLSLTGYILVKRPGASFDLSLDGLKTSVNHRERKTTAYPYFVYLSGDVLVTNHSKTYGAKNHVSLIEGDEIFTSSRSKAVIKLGEDQLIMLEPGTKFQVRDIPSRGRGLTQFYLKKGEILVDFWKSSKPLGIKILFEQGYVFGQDITLRAKSSEGETLIANDRNTLLLVHPKQEAKVEQGNGAILTKAGIEVAKYSWVDQYDWADKLNLITQTGIGREAVFKPTGMDQRQSFQRKGIQRKRQTASKSSNDSRGISHGVKKVFKQITDKATGITKVGDKIKDSQEAIESFKRKQADNQKLLDSL